MDSCAAIILSLADKLYICSRLLTAAAEKQNWDSVVVQELIHKLKESIDEGVQRACVKSS